MSELGGEEEWVRAVMRAGEESGRRGLSKSDDEGRSDADERSSTDCEEGALTQLTS